MAENAFHRATLRSLRRARGQLRALALPRPAQIHLTPTTRCFLPCQQCDLWRGKGEGELPTQTWERIIDDLAEWPGPPCGLNIAGGEPLVRKDMLGLARRAADHGFTVSTNTNGWLVDAAMAARLADAGLSFVTVSIDGARAETHDALRGREGSHARARAAVHHLLALERQPSLDVTVATILWARSVPEIPALIDWTASIGAHLTLQALYENFGTAGDAHDPGWAEDSSLFPRDAAAIDTAIDAAIAAKRAGQRITNSEAQLEAMRRYLHAPDEALGLRCRAGTHDFVIDPTGQLKACYYTEAIGQADPQTPLSAWGSPLARRRRQEVRRCPRSCSLLNCNFPRS